MTDLVAELKSSVHDEDGWASDAQDAELYMDGDHLVFNGSGSLDLGHMVALVNAWPEVSKQLAALDKIRQARDRMAENALTSRDTTVLLYGFALDVQGILSDLDVTP